MTAHVFKDRGGYRVYYLETAWMQVVARCVSFMRSFYESYRYLRVTDAVPTNHLSIHVSLLLSAESCFYLVQGVYTNRPHNLIKFDLPRGSHALTIALAQYAPVDHQATTTATTTTRLPRGSHALTIALAQYAPVDHQATTTATTTTRSATITGGLHARRVRDGAVECHVDTTTTTRRGTTTGGLHARRVRDGAICSA